MLQPALLPAPPAPISLSISILKSKGGVGTPPREDAGSPGGSVFTDDNELNEFVKSCLREFLGEVGSSQVEFDLLTYSGELSECIFKVGRRYAPDFMASLSLAKVRGARNISMTTLRSGTYLQSVR